LRPVARTARAPDSKSGGWGFKSLLACHYVFFIVPEFLAHPESKIKGREYYGWYYTKGYPILKRG
jgi:hypothetical protein